MTTLPDAAGWSGAAASMRGAAHDRTGRPNEDAVSLRASRTGVAFLGAAVADGHGGQRYVRSATGARLAVSVALDAVDQWWPGVAERADEELRRSAELELIPVIVDRWRRATADHLADEPFAASEHEAAGIDLSVEPVVAYGATLLVALATADRLVFAQLGDGDIIVAGPDGVSSPIPEDERLVGGQTTSLCLPRAEQDFRVQVEAGADIDLVIVSSDGYGNSFRHLLGDGRWPRICGTRSVRPGSPRWPKVCRRGWPPRPTPEAMTCRSRSSAVPHFSRRVPRRRSPHRRRPGRPNLAPARLTIARRARRWSTPRPGRPRARRVARRGWHCSRSRSSWSGSGCWWDAPWVRTTPRPTIQWPRPLRRSSSPPGLPSPPWPHRPPPPA